MSKKDISLNKYGISKKKYRELLYFCMQYDDWKRGINYGVHGSSSDGTPRGTGISNPTESQALKNEMYFNNIKMVEQSAIEASADLYPYIIKAVTKGLSYEYLDIPAGREAFYKARRMFFYILSTKR